MSLSFQFPKGDPRFTAAAKLHVVCPNHPGELIVDACINGVDLSDWLENVNGYTFESVAAPGTIASMQRASGWVASFLDLPVAEAEEGDEPHTRARFTCLKPSCNYNGQMRSVRWWTGTDSVLVWMLNNQMDELTITNVEYSEAMASEAWASVFGWACISRMSSAPLGRVVVAASPGLG